MKTKMERVLIRRDERFAFNLVALVNGAVKPSRQIRAPTHCIEQGLNDRRAMRSGAPASAS